MKLVDEMLADADSLPAVAIQNGLKWKRMGDSDRVRRDRLKRWLKLSLQVGRPVVINDLVVRPEHLERRP
jgi:hypothetical protein